MQLSQIIPTVRGRDNAMKSRLLMLFSNSLVKNSNALYNNVYLGDTEVNIVTSAVGATEGKVCCLLVMSNLLEKMEFPAHLYFAQLHGSVDEAKD